MYIKRTNLLLLLFFLSTSQIVAQEKSKFDYLVLTQVGHLNNDRILDSIAVKQDTINPFKPYRLEVYLSKKRNGKKLMLKTDKAFTPEYPQGANGLRREGMPNIEIRNYILTIKHDRENTHVEHLYRLQNNNKFRLIKFNSIRLDDTGKIYYETINFDRLIRKTMVVNSHNNKVLEEDQHRFKMNPRYLEDLNNVPEVH